MTITGFIILAFLVVSILWPSPKRKTRSPRHYSRRYTPYQSATASPVEAKAEAPAFLADVESTLINLQYKKKEAAQAVQRASGDSFEARLKSALDLLRIPEAKLTY